MKKKEGKTFARGEEDELSKKMLAQACTPEELEALKGISNQAYQYLGSARILGGIGKAFAEAMTPMVKKQTPASRSLRPRRSVKNQSIAVREIGL